MGKKDDRVKLSEKQLDGLQIKEETSLSQEIKGVTLSEKLGLQKMVFMMQKISKNINIWAKRRCVCSYSF